MTASPAVAQTDFGFADGAFSGKLATSMTTAASGAGADVVRVPIHWDTLQPTADAWEWQHTDAYVTSLAQAGIRPLFVLVHTPAWARDAADGCTTTPRCPPGETNLPAWEEFVHGVAARYAHVSPAGIEVWNEPNIASFWPTTSGPDAGRYARLLAASTRGVVRAGTSTPVVIGGIVGGGAPAFLDGIYKAGGTETFDVIGFHVYPHASEKNPFPGTKELNWLADWLRWVRDSNNDGATQFFITETGFSTGIQARGTCPAVTGAVSEEQQASGLLSLYDTSVARGDIKLFLVFRLRDDWYSCGERGWGTVTAGWRPKAAWYAFRDRFAPAP